MWEEPANRLPGKLGSSTSLKLRLRGLQSWGRRSIGIVRNTKSEKSHQRGYQWSWNPKICIPDLLWLRLSPLMASLSFWLLRSKPWSQLALSSKICPQSYCILLLCYYLCLPQKILSTFEHILSLLKTQQWLPFQQSEAKVL